MKGCKPLGGAMDGKMAGSAVASKGGDRNGVCIAFFVGGK